MSNRSNYNCYVALYKDKPGAMAIVVDEPEFEHNDSEIDDFTRHYTHYGFQVKKMLLSKGIELMLQ